jgi:hypothetical protein
MPLGLKLPRQSGPLQGTMSSGSGADITGDTRGVGLASMGISATGAAENSERNPRLFIPYLTNEKSTPKLCGRGSVHSTGYLFLPPVNGNSTIVPERHQIGGRRDLGLVRLDLPAVPAERSA